MGIASFDPLFQGAVSAIDAGDASKLDALLAAHPELVRVRLESPGAWLRAAVGSALEGFFRHPYLLWFVAGNPTRTERLPQNIVELAQVIVRTARTTRVESLSEQLNYTLGLLVHSSLARKSGMQLDLIDALIDEGACPVGPPHGALADRNLVAAQRLVERGSELTLATALCLGQFNEAKRLALSASSSDRQTALIAAALNGKEEALAFLIDLGVELNIIDAVLYPYATALHHAVDSGSLAAVRTLVEAGAKLDTKDRVYQGTPLGWAEHFKQPQIAAYLRARAAGGEGREVAGAA